MSTFLKKFLLHLSCLSGSLIELFRGGMRQGSIMQNIRCRQSGGTFLELDPKPHLAPFGSSRGEVRLRQSDNLSPPRLFLRSVGASLFFNHYVTNIDKEKISGWFYIGWAKIRQNSRRYWVHKIYQGSSKYGEYHHLMEQIFFKKSRNVYLM